MTIETIVGVVTAFVTFVLGIFAKKFSWVESKYIPIQNMIIGLVAGALVYLCGLTDNLLVGILLCMSSALCAGGAYDLKNIGKSDENAK